MHNVANNATVMNQLPSRRSQFDAVIDWLWVAIVENWTENCQWPAVVLNSELDRDFCFCHKMARFNRGLQIDHGLRESLLMQLRSK